MKPSAIRIQGNMWKCWPKNTKHLIRNMLVQLCIFVIMWLGIETEHCGVWRQKLYHWGWDAFLFFSLSFPYFSCIFYYPPTGSIFFGRQVGVSKIDYLVSIGFLIWISVLHFEFAWFHFLFFAKSFLMLIVWMFLFVWVCTLIIPYTHII